LSRRAPFEVGRHSDKGALLGQKSAAWTNEHHFFEASTSHSTDGRGDSTAEKHVLDKRGALPSIGHQSATWRAKKHHLNSTCEECHLDNRVPLSVGQKSATWKTNKEHHLDSSEEKHHLDKGGAPQSNWAEEGHFGRRSTTT